MALERTTLTHSILSDLLQQYYGILLVDIKKLELGSANCYRIFDGTRCYFLKEFQSSFSKDTVIQEARLLEHLSKTDIPIAQIHKTVDGEVAFPYQNHILCLEEYIDGQTYSYDDLPGELLPQVGQMLGKLHSAMKDYKLPLDMGEEWVASFSAKNVIAQYDTLIDIASKKADDSNATRIIDDLQYKKQLAIRCNEYKKYYSGVTYSSTHGDYQGCQLIFDGERIKAVIDFSSARCLPVTWEIMRSFVQSSKECRKNAEIDIEAFCEYVCEYMRYSSLTKIDLAAMPYVYLFQLARSKYGYSQYLNSDSEDRKGLLKFAFWRTQMCREVESKAELISEKLCKLI